MAGFYLLADILPRFKWREIFSREKLIKITNLKEQARQVFKQTRQNIYAFLSLFLACLVNPNHIKGLLYPFKIFTNYGYEIVENKSIFFLEKLLLNYNYQIFRWLLLILVISFLANYLFQKKIRLVDCFFGLFVSFLGLFAVRNLTIFGLVVLVIISANLYPALAFLWGKLFDFLRVKIADFDQKFKKYIKPALLSVLIFIFLFSAISLLIDRNNRQRFSQEQFGLGLNQGSEDAFNFFKENNLAGPIFNNYDSGSALIFGLADQVKVFVDNRPEAFSVDFFKKEYLPMQTDENVWQEVMEKYEFKTIVFSFLDSTPWAKTFLRRILVDQEWSLIYFDRYYVILVLNDYYPEEFLAEKRIDTWNFRQQLRSLVNDATLINKFNLAELALLAEQKDLAEEIYRQILIEKPNNPRAYFFLATLYGSSNNVNDLYKGIDYALRGLEKEPDMPGIYNQIGIIYWSLSDYSQAEHYWRLAIKKNHRDKTARDYLEQMEVLKKRGLLPR